MFTHNEARWFKLIESIGSQQVFGSLDRRSIVADKILIGDSITLFGSKIFWILLANATPTNMTLNVKLLD